MRAMIVLAAAAFSAAAIAAPSSVFDKPVKTTVVPLTRDPSNPQARPKRTCFTYPAFLVKTEESEALKGAGLSIVPLKRGKPAACTDKIAGEIDVGRQWSGYFAGVKGPFVFFDADDGTDGGMPFAVYDGKSGKQLFRDTRMLNETFHSVAITNGELVMRYRRVFSAHCSLYGKAEACWKSVVEQTDLLASVKPDCDAAYRAEMKRSPRNAATVPDYDSVIAYEVTARYVQGIFTLNPMSGMPKCWIGD